MGALEAGGSTIAVLGSGVDVIYPYVNKGLADRIVGRGCLVSEYPMGTTPSAANFPERNRIVSGMSIGTVVVEAGPRSGALITARHAMEQNREVFAVPGSILGDTSKGCHVLIKSGAKLVACWEDIAEEISIHLECLLTGQSGDTPDTGIEVENTPETTGYSPSCLSHIDRAVYNALRGNVYHLSEIVRIIVSSETRIPPKEVIASLTRLCMTGAVSEYPGRFYAVSKESGSVTGVGNT